MRSISERIVVLAAQGYIKFFRNAQDYGLPSCKGSKHGYLCVEDMRIKRPLSESDPISGEVAEANLLVLPTHYVCPQTGVHLPVENPNVWVYQEDVQP